MIGLDFGFGALEAEFWRLLFVMTRIGAAMLAAPLFGAATVPPQVRVIVTGAIAVLICAWMPVTAPAALLSLQGMVIVAGEVLIGLALGFVLQIAFAAPVMAAEVIGGSMGMSLALGAHLQWIALLLESYRVFPPGETWLGADKFSDIAAFGGTLFATAVMIALPVSLVLLVVQLVTGILSRSAPALNLFALGLPAGVLAGLAALIAAYPIITDQMADLSATAVAESRSILVR